MTVAGLTSSRCTRRRLQERIRGLAWRPVRNDGFGFRHVVGGERKAGMSHLTYAEAGFVGLLQGITELFPISSLGHAVLIPAIVGGQWAQDLNVSKAESPYLAFIVGLHVATA